VHGQEPLALPIISDLLDALHNKSIFHSIDLRSAYHQTPLSPDAQQKAAFVVPGYGVHTFSRMPIGLTGALATFQRLVEKILPSGTSGSLQSSDNPMCLAYLDDVVVGARDIPQGLEHLAAVLKALGDNGLKLHPKKSSFFRRGFTFLGHRITSAGIGTDPEKIVKVQKWPRPTSTTAVKSFLGLAQYYANYVEGFARLADPLYRLTEKGRTFVWHPEAERAFLDLKEALVSPPVLGYPRPTATPITIIDKNLTKNEGLMIIDTDASLTAAGSVLSQIQDGRERDLGYYTRAFSK